MSSRTKEETTRRILLAREAHVRKLEKLTKQGHFDDCKFASGITPSNLAEILGYNLIINDGLECLDGAKNIDEYILNCTQRKNASPKD